MRGDVIESASTADFSLVMEQWSLEYSVFVFETYISSGFSLSEASRQFNNRYSIRELRDGQSLNLIQSWIANFRTTGSTLTSAGQDLYQR